MNCLLKKTDKQEAKLAKLDALRHLKLAPFMIDRSESSISQLLLEEENRRLRILLEVDQERFLHSLEEHIFAFPSLLVLLNEYNQYYRFDRYNSSRTYDALTQDQLVDLLTMGILPFPSAMLIEFNLYSPFYISSDSSELFDSSESDELEESNSTHDFLNHFFGGIPLQPLTLVRSATQDNLPRLAEDQREVAPSFREIQRQQREEEAEALRARGEEIASEANEILGNENIEQQNSENSEFTDILSNLVVFRTEGLTASIDPASVPYDMSSLIGLMLKMGVREYSFGLSSR